MVLNCGINFLLSFNITCNELKFLKSSFYNINFKRKFRSNDLIYYECSAKDNTNID